MKKTRLIVVLLLVLTMAMSLFVACENKNDKTSENAGTTASAVTPDKSVDITTSTSDETPASDAASTSEVTSASDETPASVDDSTSAGTEIPDPPQPEKTLVTFDANGGAIEGEAVMEPDEDGYIIDAPEPAREGYKFTGWAKDAEGKEPFDPMWDEITESMTLYAVWAKICVVTFDAGEGELIGEATLRVEAGGYLSGAPTADMKSEFYTFGGWYTAAEGGDKVDENYAIAEDVTLYAHYDIITMRLWNLMDSKGTEKLGYRIEAEDATVIGELGQSGTSFIEENQTYASGKKSLGYLNVVGNRVLFTFYSEVAGKAEIAIRMSSNNTQFFQSGGTWTIYVGDQVVGNDAFTATFNGVDAPFENATLRGAGIDNPMTWNMYFDPVSFGILDIKAGINTLTLTATSTTIPNMDCLDIITELELSSADKTAASGQINREAMPLAYEKTVGVKFVIGAYDGGPAIDKAVLTFADEIAAADLASGRPIVASWGGNLGSNADKYYLCDENGNAVEAEKGYIVAIEYTPTFNQYGIDGGFTPFNYNQSTGRNTWKALNNVGLIFNNLVIGGEEYTKFTGTVEASRYIPSVDGKWDTTGSVTAGGETVLYASYAPEVKEGEKKPLIIWLHGAGEGGTDPTITILGNKVTALAEDTIQNYFGGAFVLAPQAPTMWMNVGNNVYAAGNTNTSIYIEALEKTIRDFVENNPAIDPERVYVGGCSNGGWCTLEIVARMGTFFAGCYPICAPYYGDEHFNAAQLANLSIVPMWIVAAANDTTVNLRSNNALANLNSNRLYLDMLEKGAKNVHYSLFENVTSNGTSYIGHYSWIYAFNDMVKYVQATEGANGAFALSDLNPSSQLTVKVDGQDACLWQWLNSLTKIAPAADVYQATFMANGGTIDGEESAIVKANEMGYIATLPAAVKEGYRFEGWYTAAEGGEAFNFSEQLDQDVTIYAHYVKQYTVTFDANGGALTGEAQISFDENGAITAAPTAAKEGGEFQGWFTAADGGEKVELAAYTLTADVTLYAHYGMTSMTIKNLVNADETKAGYRIEAEDCKYQFVAPSWWAWYGYQGTFIESAEAASGGQALGNANTRGNTMLFTFKANAAGKATLKLWLSSNASSGTGATTFTTDIFSVSVNGVNVAFAAQAVAGGSTYSTNFEAVILGEVDVLAGDNAVLITVGSGADSMGNVDCLDIMTDLTLTSCNGDAATGTATLPAASQPESANVLLSAYIPQAGKENGENA